MSPVIASLDRLQSRPVYMDAPRDLPGVRQVIYRNRIDEKQAEDALRQWWSGDACISSDISTAARIIRVRSEYIPFWKVSAVAEGTLKGRHDDGLEVSMLENVKYSFRQKLAWSCPAGSFPELGIQFLRNYSGIVDQSRDTPHPLPERMLPKQEALLQAEKRMEEYLRKSATMNEGITSEDIRFSGQEAELVFYPFWRLQYVYEDRMYPATIDGITGILVAGQAPGDSLVWWTTTLFIASFSLGIPLLLLTPAWGMAYIPALLGTSVLHWPITRGFAFLRFGSVVATGELSGYKPSVLNDPLNSMLGLCYLIGCFGILMTFVFVHGVSEPAERILFMSCFLIYLIAAAFTLGDSWNNDDAITADSSSPGFFAARISPAKEGDYHG